jgi:hypothetical protein
MVVGYYKGDAAGVVSTCLWCLGAVPKTCLDVAGNKR